MPAIGSTPLAKKLQIKPGRSVAVENAPEDFAGLIGELPEGAALESGLKGEHDVVIVFVSSMKDLDKAEGWKKAMNQTNVLWVCYPKGTSKVQTDLSRDTIYPELEKYSLKPNAMISIDDTWSGMRFKKV